MSKQVIQLGKERAERIKLIRSILGPSRQKFYEKYKKFGISVSTIQSWEEVRWCGLTESGAQKLVEICQEEGLAVTLEWLLFGIGEDPFIDTFPIRRELLLDKNKVSEKTKIANELRLFQLNNPDAINTIITDDALSPWLNPGDYVAGIRYFDEEIEKALDQACIIQTLSGNTYVRILKKGKDNKHYTLMMSNTESHQPVLEHIELFSAAPIVWVRKPYQQ